MPGIEEFPQLDALEGRINRAFNRAKNSLADRNPDQSEIFKALSIESIFLVGEWGQGTGEFEEDPLEVLLYVDFDDREEYVQDDVNLIDSQVYQTVASEIQSSFLNFFEPNELMEESFSGIDLFILPIDVFQESMIDIIDPDGRVFNLTDRQIVSLEGANIVRSDIGEDDDEEEEEEQEEVEPAEIAEPDEPLEGEPTSIIQFPNLPGLRDNIIQALDDAKVKEGERNETVRDMMNDLNLRRIIITGQWGAGRGEFGDDPLSILLSLSLEGMHRKPFGTTTSKLTNTMQGLIDQSGVIGEWFSDINITAVESQFFEPTLERNLEDSPTRRFFDLSNLAVIELVEGEIVTRPLAEEDEVVEEEEEPEEEEEELTLQDRLERIEEELEEAPEEVPPELRMFKTSRDGVHIPAGKPTRKVEPRPPYDFERELYTPGKARTDLPEIEEGIGHSKATQRFGFEDPPSTFPRTGVYVKYRLFYEGPTHILGLYRDLIVYAGYISILHDGVFKPGRYSSFREYVYRLREVPERGLGPPLVEQLSQQQAAARGLETVPRLPDGQPAPWLEDKVFLDIVEENMDHEAWDNVSAFIYGEPDREQPSP